MRSQPRFLMIMAFFICTATGAVFRSEGATGSAYPAEGQGQRPVARVQVRLVPVDVIVTDAAGRPVTDLKEEDFQILEDGKPQEIRHFTLQKLTEAAPDPNRRPLLRATPDTEFAPQTARTFLLLMGSGWIDKPFKSVEALKKFVLNDLLPQDRVAVFAFNRASNFTTDHEYIAQVLERFRQVHEDIYSQMESLFRGLAAIYGSHRMPESFQAKIDAIFGNPGKPGSRALPPGPVMDKDKMARDADRTTETLLRKAAVAAAIQAGDPGSLLRASLMQFDTLTAEALTDLSFSDYAAGYAKTQEDLVNIFTCIDYLRYMDGEKHLVFFTPDGLFLPRAEYDDNIVGLANDARVAIDTFQTGGLPMISSWESRFAIATLRNISEQTGGRASIYQRVDKELARLNETTRFEYLLAYYPKDENWDGKYRHIEVKVNRPGLKVSFRHGYFARDSVPVFDALELLSYRRITAAGGYTSDIPDLPFQVTTTVVEDPLLAPGIRVDLQVSPEDLELTNINGIYRGELRATIFYADNERNYLGGVWKVVTLNLQEKNYPQFQQSGIRFSIMVPEKTRRQILKVILYDPEADRVGSRLITMR